MFSISIIGSGNVAFQLGNAFKQAQIPLKQVYSRNEKTGRELAKLLGAHWVKELKQLAPIADIYIVAINDDQIELFAKQWKAKDKIVAHTSGFAAMDTLKQTSENFGVFYPFQTLTKHKQIDFNKIPLLIEGNNNQTELVLFKLAQRISHTAHSLSSNQRRHLHLAAVVLNNFTNHLAALAKQHTNEHNIPFSLLMPLLDETFSKIKEGNPMRSQTGPAARNDVKTINAHIELLQNKPHMQAVYKLLSESIQYAIHNLNDKPKS